jgi:hypothetical protein
MLGVLAFSAVPALASQPEAPEVSVVFVESTEAFVSGILNPNAPMPGEAGTYQYVYRPSTKNECKGAGEVRLPEPPEISFGLQHEELPGVFVGGLQPGTEYAICLVATEPGKTEAAVSAPVSFTTLFPPQVPETLPATVSGDSVTLNGVLNPAGPGHGNESYHFVYREGVSECEGAGSVEAPSELIPAGGEQAQHVSFAVSGLKPHTKYVYCVSIFNTAFEKALGSEVAFETETIAPAATQLAVGQLTSSEATLTAKIAPGGALTTYRVEYAPGKTTAPRILPASATPVAIVEHLVGLAANTEYHDRILLENEKGSAEAPFTFTTATTLAAGGSGSSCANATLLGFDPGLPDCRAYELVSSATETGDVYDPGGHDSFEQDITTERPFRGAADGGSVAYVADPGPSGGDGSSAKGGGNEYLSVRGPASGVGGWESADLTPPVGTGEANNREYEAFSPDLSVGILGSAGPLLAARPLPQVPAGCEALYAHSDSTTSDLYQALFTETQSPEKCGKIRRETEGGVGQDSSLIFAGESSDHVQRFFQTPAPLVAPAVQGGSYGGNLYDSAGGVVSVVNRLPGGIDPHATYGGPSDLHGNGPDLGNAVSRDGSRVFWSTVEEAESINGLPAAMPVALYGTEDPSSPSSKVVQLDAGEPGCIAEGKCRGGKGQFWGASSDGSRVFFTDCNKLVKASTANAEEGCQQPARENQLLRTGNDLYEYDFGRPVGQRLVDLTVDHNAGDPLGADVQGVLGVSEDGSYVYFVAGGGLQAEPNSRGERPSTRKCRLAEGASAALESEVHGHLPAGLGCNLYEEHESNGVWEEPRFIAALAARDGEDDGVPVNATNGPGGGSGDWVADVGSRTAEVTPDGRSLVFESTQELTGYDSSDVVGLSEGGKRGGSEVFVYDSGSGRLACASCNPTGAPPVAAIQSGKGFAAYLPISSSGTFMRRWVNTQGSEVFFDSSQPLVAGDSNGNQDVYEWEAEGAAGCPRSTSVYGGCVFLLSGGESPDRSYLVDADESGDNVFIVHRGPLGAAGQRDDKTHLYDVRVGGGFAESSLGCSGTGCQGVPPAAPLFATPASVTFNGAGNFPPPAKPVSKAKARPLTRAQKLAKAIRVCGKKPKKSRVKCDVRARQKYGTAKVKSNRRAK